MKYYFAYGSNMDRGQMKERCPNSRFIRKALLKNYIIDFTIFSPKRKCGCADVVKSKSDSVWGLLYEVDESDIFRLDDYEKHPNKYKRFTVKVISEDGQEYVAQTYEVVEKSSYSLKPSRHYLGLMISAAKDFNFPQEYQSLLRETRTID